MVLPLDKATSSSPSLSSGTSNGGLRLNKFVRRLHDMLVSEKDSGIVEWRRGLLVLQSTDAFTKQILPKYFNTRNFKTFRRQLNYYGFVHVRSFSNSGSSTTALWVNKDLAETAASHGTKPEDVASVLLLKRVEPCETAKTAEGRRVRKKMAISVIEEDLHGAVPGGSKSLLKPSIVRRKMLASVGARGVDDSDLQQGKIAVPLEHHNHNTATSSLIMPSSSVPLEITCSNYQNHETLRRAVSESSGEDPSGKETTPAPGSKPPTSSTSAANLLLLLSKAY